MPLSPSDSPDEKTQHEFWVDILREMKNVSKNRITVGEWKATVNIWFWLYDNGILTPKELQFQEALDKPLPDFNYNKPAGGTELIRNMDEVTRISGSALRSWLFFLTVLKAPEGTGLMRFNHMYGGWAPYALVAATDADGKEFRYFPFDCLEPGFQAELLAQYPIIEVK